MSTDNIYVTIEDANPISVTIEDAQPIEITMEGGGGGDSFDFAGTTTGDTIRYNSVTAAWEVKHEPLVFSQIILTPAAVAILDAEGGMWYKSSDKSVYVCTEDT